MICLDKNNAGINNVQHKPTLTRVDYVMIGMRDSVGSVRHPCAII